MAARGADKGEAASATATAAAAAAAAATAEEEEEEDLDGGALVPLVETEVELESGQLPPPPPAPPPFAPAGSQGWRPVDEVAFKQDLKAATAEAERPLMEQVIFIPADTHPEAAT